MEVQTRNTAGGTRVRGSLAKAFEAAKEDPTIWKISFNASSGERIRLVRTDEGWVYEDIMGSREI